MELILNNHDDIYIWAMWKMLHVSCVELWLTSGNGWILNSWSWNEDQTECLIVWKNNDIRRLDVSTYWIDDDTVYVKMTVKDLGVIIDSTVSSKEQIVQVVRTTGCHLPSKKYFNSYEVLHL